MTFGRGLPILLAASVAAFAGTDPEPAAALYRKPCRFCGRPWFYPEPEILVPSLPHSFALTVPLDAATGAGTRSARLDRYAEVGPALGACWNPGADFDGVAWHAITIRIAFKRDGTVYGQPRIPFVDAATASARSDLSASLLAALDRCTPLAFSPSLGSAIAGEIFAIRFTHQE